MMQHQIGAVARRKQHQPKCVLKPETLQGNKTTSELCPKQLLCRLSQKHSGPHSSHKELTHAKIIQKVYIWNVVTELMSYSHTTLC